MANDKQTRQMRDGKGFIAALDQSGGSTPKALKLYGIADGSWANDEEMFGLIHAMRARIATSKAFDGGRVIGAILFERTMDGEIGGKPAAAYLWEEKGVVPFLKIDQGLEAEADGVRLMKPIKELEALLARAARKGIFGTKERSVIDEANPKGIEAVVAQQFDLGRQVLAAGLMPIIEPEVTITIPDKAEAEAMLMQSILRHLDALPSGQQVMLKLSLPTVDGFFRPLVDHPKVLRVVALSGGHSRDDANRILARNPGVIASFSRALTEGLSAGQTDAQFDATLDKAIGDIAAASRT
jgi:fructose-bisphosphate aldolase class I